jgi:basic membrane protein A
MNRKILSIGFLIIASIGLFLSAVPVTAQTVDANIAVVFSTGGLGDKSFNDAAYAGLIAADDEYNLNYDYVEPADVNEINQAILDYAADTDTDWDLIIAIGFSSFEGVNATATEYPDKNFVIIDSVVELDNVASVVFKEQEGSFLVGALAGMVTQTNKLGFLGGLDIPLINRFGAGFEHGARYINPNVTVDVAYSPNPDNPWGDLAGGKQVAESFIDDGADIIFAAAGGTGLGVFDAAEEASTETDKVYGIGVDSNQDGEAEGFVLTSMIKRVDVAVKSQIDAVVDGTWDAGFQSLGIAEDGVGLTAMEFTQDEANAEYETGVTRLEKIEELKQMIKDGDIVVAEDFDSVDDLLTPDTTTTTTPTSETTETPIYITPFILMILAIPIMKRKFD